VEPTKENVELISKDLSNQLYESAYVNFLSSLPRPILEDFAALAAQNNTSSQIAQVYDQYLNFVVSEPDLFSLHLDNVYYLLNSGKTSDAASDEVVDKIVGGLFSVVVTMGMRIPQIVEQSFTETGRIHSYHSMSQRRRCRDDCTKTRPKAPGLYSKLERQLIHT